MVNGMGDSSRMTRNLYAKATGTSVFRAAFHDAGTGRSLENMTTLATRMRELGDKEDFDIAVLDGNGAPVPLNSNGFRKYDYDRKAKGDMTVTEWKNTRFTNTYPGFLCIVLNGDGSEAHGNSKLSSVRATYEADGSQ